MSDPFSDSPKKHCTKKPFKNGSKEGAGYRPGGLPNTVESLSHVLASAGRAGRDVGFALTRGVAIPGQLSGVVLCYLNIEKLHSNQNENSFGNPSKQKKKAMDEEIWNKLRQQLPSPQCRLR